MSNNLIPAEKIVYDRIATVLNYNNGAGNGYISFDTLKKDYKEIGGTHLEEDVKNLGFADLKSLLRKLYFRLTPQNKISTLLPGTHETGVAGVIALMQKTRENPIPRAKYGYGRQQPRSSQSNTHRSLSVIPSSQLQPSQGLAFAPRLPPRRSSLADPPLSEHFPMKHDTTTSSSCNNQTTVTSMATSRPVQDQLSFNTLNNTDTVFSVGDKSFVFDPTAHDLPPFTVKAIIFDTSSLQFKVALKRPPTAADAAYFKFCSRAHYALDALPILQRENLMTGKCYFIKFCGKYYRGIYLAPSRDNIYGLFDFADFEVVRPVHFDHIREFPKIDEIRIPFMVIWVYTDVCKVKTNDRVYCLFSPKFEETCSRKIHHAQLQKIED
uniref:HTH OST-type domain-containing protein n=1 Tax=Panagrolaimus davidi TaxID=227884 RepID=A0A914QMH3_9BILA